MEKLTMMKIENVEDFPGYIDKQNSYWRQDLIESIESNEPFFYIFALVEKRVVGLAIFRIINDMECLYGSLRVMEDMRRKGIAQKIIEASSEDLRTKGIKKLTAYINKDNIASLNLHKKLLFQLSENQEYRKALNGNVFWQPEENIAYDITL